MCIRDRLSALLFQCTSPQPLAIIRVKLNIDMLLCRFLFACVAGAALLCAQAPTAPVISARGVTNFFTQEPAPGIIGLGGLVQIGGLLTPPRRTVTGTSPM